MRETHVLAHLVSITAINTNNDNDGEDDYGYHCHVRHAEGEWHESLGENTQTGLGLEESNVTLF